MPLLGDVRAAHGRDANEWDCVRAQLANIEHAYWHMDAADTQKAWPIETRPFVLFGEHETEACGLPSVDLFVYSDTIRRLAEDLSRLYGSPGCEHLQGNSIIYRDPPGGWSDRHFLDNHPTKIEVEIVQLIPLVIGGADVEVPEHFHTTTAERFPQGLLVYFLVEARYAGPYPVEQHHVLFSPRPPGEVIDHVLNPLGIKPEYIARAARNETWAEPASVACREKEFVSAVERVRPSYIHASNPPQAIDVEVLKRSPHFPQSPFETLCRVGPTRVYRVGR